MKRSNWIWMGILLIAAVVLAPLMKTILQYLLIEPIAYYAWRIKRLLEVVSQKYYWIFFVASVGIIVYFSILRNIILNQSKEDPPASRKGQVETLSNTIQRTQKGTYFKWAMANSLSHLAIKVLSHQNGKTNEEPNDFSSIAWTPSEKVRKYFDAGIHSSFMEYRSKRRFFRKKQKTPFDLDLNEIIGYLESEME